MRLSHADGRLFSRERALRWHGYQSDREATGRWRPGSRYLRRGREKECRQVLCREGLGVQVVLAVPISTWVQQQKRQPTPALSAAQQQQQQHDDTTRYDTTRPVAAAAIAPHLAIAMAQHHRHRPPSRPQQWYLASHCLVCGMTKVSFVVRTQAARRVLSQIRRPRRPLYGPSYQGMATSVKVVALDLSLALALPNRAVNNEAKGLNLVPSI